MTVAEFRTIKSKPPAGPSANVLTKEIIRFITLNKGFATRVNSQGQWDPTKRIMRTGTTVKGMTDIVGVYKGLALFVEVKAGKDVLSLAQLEVKRQVTAAGGRWFCARDFDSF